MVRHAVGVTKDTDGALSRLGGQCGTVPALGASGRESTTSVWSVTMIRSLSYSSGLYPRDQTSEPVGPTVAVSWIATDLPAAVAGAFASDGIGGLAGTFGDETLGESVEIDDLDVETDTGGIRIRVYNRGIGLMLGMGPELVQLHRFISTIHAAANREPGP